MFEWLAGLTVLESVLAGCAIVGSLVFLVQLVMMLVGGGEGDIDGDSPGVDGDLELDGDADIDGGETAHADSDVAFKVFSVQGTVAFFMMLGWVSLAAMRAGGMGVFPSVGLGVVAGVVVNLLMAKAFQSFRSLQSSGTMDLRNALGQEGEVYLTIRPGEPGKVQVAVQGHLKVFDAVSDEEGEIATGARVKVVRVTKGNTMVVERV